MSSVERIRNILAGCLVPLTSILTVTTVSVPVPYCLLHSKLGLDTAAPVSFHGPPINYSGECGVPVRALKHTSGMAQMSTGTG
jgi:hypothetical protein